VTNVADEQRFAEALTRIQVEGLGERRAEGFGQVRFNHAILDSESVKFVEEKSANNSPNGQETLALTSDEEEYLGVLKRAALTAEIRRAAATLAADPRKRREALSITEKKPTDSQFGNLRSIMSTVTRPNDPMVMDWLTHHNDPKDLMGKKWGKDAMEKLRNLFGDEKMVWHLLFGEGEWKVGQPLKDKSAGDADSKWAEAVHTLLDQCIRFEKRDREKSRGGRG
jgi:CRISPR-associated protein Csx10